MSGEKKVCKYYFVFIVSAIRYSTIISTYYDILGTGAQFHNFILYSVVDVHITFDIRYDMDCNILCRCWLSIGRESGSSGGVVNQGMMEGGPPIVTGTRGPLWMIVR